MLRLSIFLLSALALHETDAQFPRQPGRVTEYAAVSILDTPCETEFHPLQPDIAWVELIAGNALLRVNVTSGEETRFPLQNPLGLPSGMEFMQDGCLWFSEVAGNSMVRLNPVDGSMTTFPFPWSGVGLLDNLPVGPRVTIDVSGNRDSCAYFTAAALNAIGCIDIFTYEYELYLIPTPLSVPAVIQPGPTADTMVFAELVGNKIGVLNIVTKQITEFEVPTPASLVQALTTGPDGLVYYSGNIGGQIGSLNIHTGEFREIFIADIRAAGKSTVIQPDGTSGLISDLLGESIGSSALTAIPGPLRFGADGKLYFVEGNLVFLGNRIGAYDFATGELMEYVTPTSASGPCDLNNQIPGTIFFAEFTGGKLGRLDY
ncbi:hypothetical protein CB0940_09687 [Cercospora beticola]|uniref:Virginiamycin B lyase n=1 Tax=Cercospora beticola TaxID=122368 RepID=A0A2G5HHK8_CERBT|nr:hypothetical protein CB0940_09687 [Cercospora beticola]PIA92028.1 hypothetical protein CB0940_09687 [Cercospora beticola]WPB05973.1 hypothetical protein RHO25_010628 [Cercospora beticola]CAK1365849.1 unnamed protein product [Cercospora beticola]